ncbi:MAG: histidine phosphatase family protein [Acidobacteriota bacterium]|nr:histidine phosphatase family protein [Acidobacteriota bacterium]
MSTLTLVRHAQATPFDSITDRLSPLGEEQSRRLGDYWRTHSVLFDEAYTGTMQRHLRTAELAGISAFTQDPAFNEYPAEAILRASPDYTPTRDNREFQKIFEGIMPRWMDGSLTAPDLESWVEFRERVTGGFRRILEGEGNRRVLVITSGGPIGIAVQTALRAPERTAIEVNWRIRNCSITELVFTRGRVSLDTFNATPHLEVATFR